MPAPAVYVPKPFCCDGCGWVLGESYRRDGRRVTQLRVLRMPVERAGGSGQQADFVAVGVNDATVVCGHCGAETAWYANQNAIEDMLSRRRVVEEVVG